MHEDSTTHAQELSCKCELCHKHFKHQDNLKAHAAPVHDSCQYGLCPCTIGPAQNLRRHLKVQHDVIDLRHPIQSNTVDELHCDMCEMTNPTREYLMTHISTHHSSKNVNLSETVCNICGNISTIRLAKLQHAKRHNTPEQICEVCGINRSPNVP